MQSNAYAGSDTFPDWPAVGTTRVPSWIYTEPALFEREMERFHHGPAWNFVGLECEVPEPNSWKRGSVGLRSVLLTRDKNGDVHVVENRCSHRGSPICWELSGAGNGLTCPYHQWRFSLNGELTGLPFENGLRGVGGMPSDFDKARHPLRKLQTVRRGGAVWASFDDAPPPFEDYAGAAVLAAMDRIDQRGQLKFLGISRQIYRANWKMWLENARDAYHATLLHTFLTAFRLIRADLPKPESVSVNGHVAYTTFTRPEVDSAAAVDAQKEMRNLRTDYGLNDPETVETTHFDYDDGMNMGFHLFPSVMYQPHLNAPSFRQIVPLSVDSHEIRWTFFGFEDDDEEMTRRRLKHANLVGPAGFVTAEDGEVLVKIQRTVTAAPGTEQILEMGLLTPDDNNTNCSEYEVRQFYEHYRRVMGF